MGEGHDGGFAVAPVFVEELGAVAEFEIRHFEYRDIAFLINLFATEIVSIQWKEVIVVVRVNLYDAGCSHLRHRAC